MMEIRPIRNEHDYNRALKEVAQYFENEPGPATAEADRFDVLSTLIEAYESRHWPIESADPVEVIRYVMEARGFKQADLAMLLGSKSRASELLNRQRSLTLHQATRLHSEWGVPANVLLQPSAPKAPAAKKSAKEKTRKTRKGKSKLSRRSPLAA